MRFRTNYLILLIFLLILNISLGEFHTGGESEFPFEDIAQYNPLAQLYNSIVPESWRLTNDDYYALVRGVICTIPLVGAILDSTFSVFFGKLYPGKQYVQIREFENRMKQLELDMRNFTVTHVDIQIRNLVTKTLNSEFNGLRQCAQNYFNLIGVFNYQINETGVANSQLKDNLPVSYWIFLTKAEESLYSFSEPSFIHLVGKVYIETAFYYLSLLRDGHFNGISMGISSELVNGLPEPYRAVETFSDKLDVHSFKTLDNVALIFSNLITEQSNGKTCIGYYSIGTEYCKGHYKNLPNFSLVVSRILYSNLVNYKGKILFLKFAEISDNKMKNSELTVNINVTNSISIIDFISMGKNINRGLIVRNPYAVYSQTCDFVTGMLGFHYSNYFALDSKSPSIINITTKDYFRMNTISPPQRASFFTNIVLNELTNKNIKFRLYFSEPIFYLGTSELCNFVLKIGRLKPGENDLTYFPNIFQNGQFIQFKDFLVNALNVSENVFLDPKTGFKIKRITSRTNGYIESRYYLESPSFNFEDSINGYFELQTVGHFSYNLLSLEIITSTATIS